LVWGTTFFRNELTNKEKFDRAGVVIPKAQRSGKRPCVGFDL